jgi:iron-sulfur cluster assembly protein
MSNEATIILTERAAKEVLSIMKEQEFDATRCYLRVGCRGGGCSGFSYVLDISEIKKETDESFEQNGVILICDPKSLLYLNGTKIDFKDEIMGRGFVFLNPNATSSCGCGSSFSA